MPPYVPCSVNKPQSGKFMSHYEKRLEEDWANIQHHLTKVSGQVEQAIVNAIEALLQRDAELAYATILADNPINRAFESINQLCYAFVARHLPSAGHLRRISSILPSTCGWWICRALPCKKSK